MKLIAAIYEIGELFLYGIDANGKETRVEMIDAKNGNFYYG